MSEIRRHSGCRCHRTSGSSVSASEWGSCCRSDRGRGFRRRRRPEGPMRLPSMAGSSVLAASAAPAPAGQPSRGASGWRARHAAKAFSYSSSSSVYTLSTQLSQPPSQQSPGKGFSGGRGRGSGSFMRPTSVPAWLRVRVIRRWSQPVGACVHASAATRQPSCIGMACLLLRRLRRDCRGRTPSRVPQITRR